MTEQRARELPVNGARIYIAARFSRRPECNQLAQVLKYRGALITSRWVKPDCDHVLPTGLSRQAEDHERQRFALEDVDDVRAANWMISLMEEPRSNTRGGRHIEFGLALALGHRLTIIGPRETVFHHLPEVEHFNTIDDFVASLPNTRPTLSTPSASDGEKYKLMLLDLLAVIHRDGGHMTQELGIKLAYEQALQLSSERQFAESAKSPSDSVREALDDARAICERIRDESTHATITSEDYRHGFRAGSNGCVVAIMNLADYRTRAALQSSEADK